MTKEHYQRAIGMTIYILVALIIGVMIGFLLAGGDVRQLPVEQVFVWA